MLRRKIFPVNRINEFGAQNAIAVSVSATAIQLAAPDVIETQVQLGSVTADATNFSALLGAQQPSVVSTDASPSPVAHGRAATAVEKDVTAARPATGGHPIKKTSTFTTTEKHAQSQGFTAPLVIQFCAAQPSPSVELAGSACSVDAETRPVTRNTAWADVLPKNSVPGVSSTEVFCSDSIAGMSQPAPNKSDASADGPHDDCKQLHEIDTSGIAEFLSEATGDSPLERSMIGSEGSSEGTDSLPLAFLRSSSVAAAVLSDSFQESGPHATSSSREKTIPPKEQTAAAVFPSNFDEAFTGIAASRAEVHEPSKPETIHSPAVSDRSPRTMPAQIASPVSPVQVRPGSERESMAGIALPQLPGEEQPPIPASDHAAVVTPPISDPIHATWKVPATRASHEQVNAADNSEHNQEHTIELSTAAKGTSEPAPQINGRSAVNVLRAEVAPSSDSKVQQLSIEPPRIVPAPGGSGTEIQRGAVAMSPGTADKSPSHTALNDAAEAAGDYPQIVHNAKLVQQISGSEWRVGLQTPEFGRIEIRTNTREGLAQAQLSVEHTEVHRIFAASEAELGNALARHKVDFAGTTLMNSSSHSGGGEQKQSWQAPQHQSNSLGPTPSQRASPDLQFPPRVHGASSGSSLNILA